MSVVFSEVIMERETKGCVCMNVGFGKREDEGGMPRRSVGYQRKTKLQGIEMCFFVLGLACQDSSFWVRITAII